MLAQLGERYGWDAALLNISGNTYVEMNNHDLAEEAFKKAIALEPDYELVYWSYLTELLQTKNYAQVSLYLNHLEDRFGYEFTQESLSEEPFYSDYVASKEFTRWLASRKKS